MFDLKVTAMAGRNATLRCPTNAKRGGNNETHRVRGKGAVGGKCRNNDKGFELLVANWVNPQGKPPIQVVATFFPRVGKWGGENINTSFGGALKGTKNSSSNAHALCFTHVGEKLFWGVAGGDTVNKDSYVIK